MLKKIFDKFFIRISELTDAQRKKCVDRLQVDESENNIPLSIADAVATKCPHCRHERIIKWNRVSGLQRWKCKDCCRTFNILTNTPLARLRKKDKWITHADAMIDRLTVRRTAEKCGVHPNTAFRWRHRFTQNQGRAQCTNLCGIAESDVTFFYNSEKGSRSLKRKPRKRGGHGIPKGFGPQLVSVITLLDRHGKGAERVAPNRVRQHAYDLYTVHLKPDTLLLTDGDKSLCAAISDICKAAEARDAFAHRALIGLKESRGEKHKPYHIQTVNSFHSHLVTWMGGFNGVATKYLENYLGWHRHLKNKTHKNDPNLFIQLAFNPASIDQQLTVT